MQIYVFFKLGFFFTINSHLLNPKV